MTGQRVVIAGGAGFVGSHLTERLIEDGFEVLCFDDLSTGRVENLENLSGTSSFNFVEQDITRPFQVSGPVDLVLHFASAASPVDYSLRPLETLSAGSLGTFNLLDLAQSKSARFVFASTSEVYGNPLVHPQREDYWGNVNPIGPRCMYDEAKRFGEATTTVYRRSHGVDARIVRIFNTYGPKMRLDDGRMIPTFVGQALRGEAITVAGTGLQTRTLCYVSDLVEGVVRLLHSDLAGPVNLGGQHETTVLEMAKLIRDHVGSSSEIEFIARPEDDPDLRRPDISLAIQELGWGPKIELEQGLRTTIKWFASEMESDSASMGSERVHP